MAITSSSNSDSISYRRLIGIRGGKDKKDKKKKELEEAVIDEAEDGIDDDLMEDDMGDDDVEGGGQQLEFVKSITDMWDKTPPITQIYIGSSIGITLASMLLNKNNWPDLLHLDWKPVLTGLQIWRPFTAFLFFGPFGLNYILTIQFVWTYMAQLEKLNYNKPEEFFMMIMFGITALLGGYSVLGLSPKFLGHNLSTYLVYIWARIFEGTDVNVMDLLVLRAELLPWFFCAQTLVLEGEFPFADILGIVVGHLFHYLMKKKLLIAPSFVKNMFTTDSMKRTYGKFKEDFE